MNISSEQISEIKKLADGTKSVLIAIRPNPEMDHIASALSFYLILSGMGKQVEVVCPTDMTVEFSHLIGVDRIKKTINNQTGRNLIVSFPYQEGSIEKVSYNIENNKFNLVIEPREGYDRISNEEINFNYSGGSIDLIFTIGAASLNEFGELYSESQELLSSANIVNIDNQTSNTQYGKINLVSGEISSISELLSGTLSIMGFSMNADIATNLLSGITASTNNFTSDKTTANTFEAAAICLKNGAVKIKKAQSETAFEFPPKPSINPSQHQQAYVKPQKSFSFAPKMQGGSFGQQQNMKPKIQTPKQHATFQSQNQPKQQVSFQPQNQPKQQPQGNDAPADWLKPKIYKGSTLL